MRLLIVNADDFGLNRAANAGIIESYLAGGITSTTIMANGEAFDQAAELAVANMGLAVGLHFNLTWGRPLSAPESIPSLVGRGGALRPRQSLAIRALWGRLNAEQIRRELEAQFARVVAAELVPTHVDSHQHVHGFPAIFKVVAEFCSDHDLPMRVPWIGPHDGGSLSRRARRTMLDFMISRATRSWRGRLRWNDSLGSVFELAEMPETLGDEHYRGLLERATGDSFELMVHPVASAEDMRGYTRVGAVGQSEYRYLTAGSLPELAAKYGFKLGTFRDLPRLRGQSSQTAIP